MKMCRRFLFLLELLFLIHGIVVRGEDENPKPLEKSEPVTPVIERSSHHQVHFESSRQHENPRYQGFWKKKFIWRPRWVKTWQEKKVYVAVWKKMWSPASVKEWVPVPKPPPGWMKPTHGHTFIKGHH